MNIPHCVVRHNTFAAIASQKVQQQHLQIVLGLLVQLPLLMPATHLVGCQLPAAALGQSLGQVPVLQRVHTCHCLVQLQLMTWDDLEGLLLKELLV
jgi:hypothetical protein